MLLQDFYVIIDCDISAPGHDREVFDGINATYKRFLFPLMSTVQLPGAKMYDTQMEMHYKAQTENVSLSLYYKNSCLMRHANME